MAFVYIVRCNFTEPKKEPAWNSWYSGPKIAQMLRKPHFRTCQRFARISGTGRNYLALWTLQSPDAFKTQQYTTDWGFFEWAPYITDWSRDLFDGRDAAETAFAVPSEGALRVVSFDGMSPDEAGSACKAIAKSQTDMMWLRVVGLDRHTPVIGLRVLRDRTEEKSLTGGGAARLQQAIYRPISGFATSSAAS
jgi:hypothetical protein